jgi:hypothetical protein
MRKFLSMLILAGVVAAPSLAADPCGRLPDVARQYLKAHPGWRVLTLADLYQDDKALWSEYHQGSCPGMAELDFDGSGKKHVALALMRGSGEKAVERIILVRPKSGGLDERTLISDFDAYNVIWRLGPGVAQEWDSDKKVSIRHDSLVVEHLESATQQWYWKNGKFHYVQTSD